MHFQVDLATTVRIRGYRIIRPVMIRKDMCKDADKVYIPDSMLPLRSAVAYEYRGTVGRRYCLVFGHSIRPSAPVSETQVMG